MEAQRASRLVHHLQSSHLDTMIAAAREIVEAKVTEAMPALWACLKTAGHRERSAIAGVLASAGAQEAMPTLFELLRDPKTVGHRGSLLFAVMHMDCSDWLLDLIELAADPFYEVRMKVLICIESIKKEVPRSTVTAAAERLGEMQHCSDLSDEQRDDLASALRIVRSLTCEGAC